MNSNLASRLQQLPALDAEGRTRLSPKCKICAAPTAFFDVNDFNKACSQVDCYAFGRADVAVPYFRCEQCGFLFTTFFDDWSHEDFARFIYNGDYLKVDGEYLDVRPASLAVEFAERLRGFESARILDFGSGMGVFADRLRSMGFESVESYDPFANPRRPEGLFDVITCFEVIEHTSSPIETVRDMRELLTDDGCIVFSQTLQPDNIASIRGSWWYLAPRNGHISTFTRDSLALIGNATGLTFHGRTSPFAFSQAASSEVAERLLGQIGLPEMSFVLSAPLADERVSLDQWNELEHSPQGAFRWTRSSQVVWPLSPAIKYPAVVRFAIPFRDEVRPAFAAECSLSVGDAKTTLALEHGRLVGEISLSRRGAQEVVLSTPEPVTPWELRGAADHRNLGLAIAASPVTW